jgi:hypothetical protein
MLAVLTIPVLAGCGSARMSSDPFVGTWQTGWGTELVIGKSASGYTGAWAAADTNPRVVRFTKVRLDGESLFADVPDSIFGPAHMVITLPAKGKLIVSERAPTKESVVSPIALTRLSDSTALPSASP